jgi:hypothetical protein
MSRKRLIDLANNPDHISGIYNYCDRWCERCPLTSRCLVYATETEDPSESNDIRNEMFWRQIGDTLTEVRELLPEWSKQALNLNQAPEENTVRRQSRQVDHDPLVKAGKRYANAASDWFRELDQAIELTTNPTDVERQQQPFEDAREVIQWYQFQIAVKTMRALSSQKGEDSEGNDVPKDSDGLAKVALIGIDRSIAGWRLMQLSLSDRSESIVPLILQLDRLRNNLEKSFPQARDFIRPGLDEVAES